MDLWVHLKIWLSGNKLPDSATLFGLSVVWWVRLAKMLQFVSASVILAELVGFDRLRAGGDRIRKLITWKSIFTLPTFWQGRIELAAVETSSFALKRPEPQFITDPPEVYGPNGKPLGPRIRRLNPKYSQKESDEYDRQLRTLRNQEREMRKHVSAPWLHKVFGYLGVFLLFLLTLKVRHLVYQQLEWFIFILMVPVAYLVSMLLFLLVIAVLLRLPIVIAETLILEPVGRLLTNPRLKSLVLAVSYSLLLLGFLIDLFTS